MDKFWSICAVPLGILLCFGPALVTWLVAEWKDARRSESNQRR